MQVCGVDRHATKTSKLIVESIINGVKNIKVDTVQIWTTFFFVNLKIFSPKLKNKNQRNTGPL